MGCKYCGGRLAPGSDMCANCRVKLPYVRKLLQIVAEIKAKSSYDEQAFIEGIEFNLDYGLPVPDEYLKKYRELIEKK